MKSKDILEGLGFIDEKFIEEANEEIAKEKIKKSKILKMIVPIAASLAIIVTSIAFWQQGQNLSPIQPNVDNLPSIVGDNKEDGITATEYTLSLNEANAISNDRNLAIKGHFWNELTDKEIKEVLPIISEKYDINSTVHYSSEDNVATIFQVYSNGTTSKNQSIGITIAPNKIEKCYIIDGEPILSEFDGISIEAGLFITDKNSNNEQDYVYFADFKIDNIAYYIEFRSENKEAEEDFKRLIPEIILGGKANLSILENPIIPKLIDEELLEEEAYNEVDFGKYLFEIPSAYEFNGAYRWLNQNRNSLYASWSNGYDDISISVSPNNEESISRIVSPEEINLYDISLYSIPWAESIPSDIRQIVENPVFNIEDLTLDMIKMRGYIRNEVGDPSSNSLNLRFSVLYDDIIIEIRSEGLSAEYLYEQLISLDTH